jgi:hypothetical protein
MVKTQDPTIVRIRLPVKAPTRCVTGLALGASMILGTAWMWLARPGRFADPCVPVLLLAAGIVAFAAGVSWFSVDHAILVDPTRQEIHYDARRKHSSWLNASSIKVRRENASQVSRRPVWRVYLVKTTEQEDMLWEGRRQQAASRIAQALSRHILKPWFLSPSSHGPTDEQG